MATSANLCMYAQIFSFGKVGKQLCKEEEPCFYAELPHGLQNSFLRFVYSIPTAVEVSVYKCTQSCYTVRCHAPGSGAS